jgi:hypothetical protein
MAELSKIRKNGVDYDIKDVTAREALEQLKQNGVTNEQVTNAVNQYLEAHPVNGLNSTEKNLIMALFRNAAYTINMSTTIGLLENLWNSTSGGEDPDIPDEPDEPDVPVVTKYTITNELVNVKSSNSTSSVNEGASYTATLTADDGYEISNVVVTMGGADVTASVYANGVITIASVTGNVEIIASAEMVEQKPAELPEDGLIAYFDLRNMVSDTDYNNKGSGGKTTVNDKTGNYWAYCWANNSIALSDERGLQNANTRGLTVAPIGTTSNNIKFADTVKTLAILSYDDDVVGAVYKTANQMGYEIAPKYLTESGESITLDKAALRGSEAGAFQIPDDPNGYWRAIVKIQGNKLAYFFNGKKILEYDGDSLDGFASWEARECAFVSQNGRVTATVYYSSEMTDTQAVELDAYLLSLEVSA